MPVSSYSNQFHIHHWALYTILFDHNNRLHNIYKFVAEKEDRGFIVLQKKLKLKDHFVVSQNPPKNMLVACFEL